MREHSVRLLLVGITGAILALLVVAVVSAWAEWGLVPDGGAPVVLWSRFWATVLGLLVVAQVGLAVSWFLVARAHRAPVRGGLAGGDAAQRDEGVAAAVDGAAAEGSHPEVRRRVKELEAAVAERKWDRVEELVEELERLCRDRAVLERVRELVDAERAEHVRELTEQLEAAKQEANPQGVLDLRDRLVGLLETKERRKLDEMLAAWSLAYLREALHEGRTRELIDLIERMVETFGESTPEGLELKNALPILRRSAGRCPDCGKPYDISLERCPECERRRMARKKKIAADEHVSEDPGGNGRHSTS